MGKGFEQIGIVKSGAIMIVFSEELIAVNKKFFYSYNCSTKRVYMGIDMNTMVLMDEKPSTIPTKDLE